MTCKFLGSPSFICHCHGHLGPGSYNPILRGCYDHHGYQPRPGMIFQVVLTDGREHLESTTKMG